MGELRLISIVCPVYNEEESIPIFYGRLRKTLDALQDRYTFEIIFTNNRSHDRSLEVIRAIRAFDPSVQVLTLSRNFGYQPSLMSGIRNASGDAIVCIDVDCEDPPEMIPRFIEEWEKGFDLVYGDRKKRSEPAIVQWGRLVFYRINRIVADTEIVLDMADFGLLSHRLRDLMLANHTTFPFLRTESAYVGFERKGINYVRQPRVKGKSHYNFIAMTKFAAGGILSSSTFPLRAVVFVFPLAILTTMALAILDFAGMAAAFHLMVAVDLLYIMFSCACAAIYIARSYKNGVSRPVFIVDWQQSAVNANCPRWTTDDLRGVCSEEC